MAQQTAMQTLIAWGDEMLLKHPQNRLSAPPQDLSAPAAEISAPPQDLSAPADDTSTLPQEILERINQLNQREHDSEKVINIILDLCAI